MIEFKTYITEAASSEEKLTHLEHAEDHPINAGATGYEHAKNTLMGVHHALQGKKSDVSITTKYDGSPSIVFGRHPETGKFFIASKSAFNKAPKINYTEADIDANHGHAPGLASKLKLALKHLPKVTPKSGVFQGDIMHSGVKSESNPEGDVTIHNGQAHFTPNTITYSTKKPGEAEQVSQSKIGVAVHTAYHGKSFEDLKAKYNAGQEGFKSHKDVHLLDVSHNTGESKRTPEQGLSFENHIKEADRLNNELKKSGGYDAIAKHSDHLKTFINQTVRTGETPSIEGYKKHLTTVHQKAADKLKTEAGKAKPLTAGKELVSHANENATHLENVLKLHRTLQAAKDDMVHSLASHQTYGHSIGGKAVKPEGFVAVVNNRPTKLVDRAEFSAANFAKNAQ